MGRRRGGGRGLTGEGFGVATENGGEVRGEGGAGQDDVSAGVHGALFEVDLHVRHETEEADGLSFGLVFQFLNEFDGVDGFGVEVKDDERGEFLR